MASLLRLVNVGLSTVLVLYWALFLLCPHFREGPVLNENLADLPGGAVCPGLNHVKAGFALRGHTFISGTGRNGAQQHRSGKTTWLRVCNRILLFVLLLSGDIELNPGPVLTPGKLAFAHLNPRSVLGSSSVDKPTLIQNYITDGGIDFLALSETWLKPDSLPASINSITPDGFSCVHVPRTEGRGGGVAFIYRSCLDLRQLACGKFSSFEIITAKLVFNSVSYIFTNIYRPPSTSLNMFFDEFSSLLEELATTSSAIFISGDFNVHVDTDESNALNFRSLLSAFGLEQLVDFPTHIGGHTLDLLISNEVGKIGHILPTYVSFSDHQAFSCDIAIPQCRRPVEKAKKVRIFKNFDVKCFCSELVASGLNCVSGIDLDLFVNCMVSTVGSLLDRFAPWKTVKCSGKNSQPFFTRELRNEKRIKSKLESRWRRNKTSENFQAYKFQVKRFSVLLRDAKRNYYKSAVTKNANNSKKLWSFLNKVICSSNFKVLPTFISEGTLANSFSDFFNGKISRLCAVLNSGTNTDGLTHYVPPVPPPLLAEFSSATEDEVRQCILSMSDATCDLDIIPTKRLKECVDAFVKPITILINKCFQEGRFPTRFKQALVVPLLKKMTLPKEELSSYRPVSHLNFISKVIEKVICTRLIKHIDSFSGFAVNQSAYRMFHSTETALLKVQNDLLLAFGNQEVSALTLLDLSAAFDTVDHAILTERLQKCFGLGNKALSLLSSYLTDRTQSVQIGDRLSDPVTLTTGVPQGSILGPLLFSLYVAPLEHLLASENVSFHFYADDTQVYISFSAKECTNALLKLGQVLNKLQQWFSLNRLSLNPDKTEFILIGSRQQRNKLSDSSTDLAFSGCSIQPTDCVRNLGVLFDNDLSFKDHVLKTCQLAFWNIRNLRRIRKCLDLNSTKLLTNALVTSRLDYCNSLFYGMSNRLLNRLQSVQNSLARIVMPQVKRHEHITPTLKQLHWLPVRQRIIFKIGLLTHKVLNNKGPQYLRDTLNLLPASNRRSSCKKLLDVPFCKFEKARGAFSVAAPCVWNSLPQALRDCSSENTFKSKLKTHLFPG